MSEQEPLITGRPPSYLERVEDALVAALKAGVPGSAKVDAYPANPDSYDFAGLEAAVLVHYQGSRYSGREGPANANQARRLNFNIILLTRKLRTHSGAYTTLEDIRLALQGAVFEGAGPAEIVSDSLTSENQGLWRWDIVIGLNTPAIARNRAPHAALMRPATTTTETAGRGDNAGG